MILHPPKKVLPVELFKAFLRFFFKNIGLSININTKKYDIMFIG
jgi:hypothetical protein